MKYDDLSAILQTRLRPSSAAGWVPGFTLAVGLLVGAVWLAAEVEPYVGTDWAAVVALGVMVAVPGVVALGDMLFARKARPLMRRPPVPIITPSEFSEDIVRALAMATGLQVERTDHGALIVKVPLRGFPLPDWIDRHGCPACGRQGDRVQVTQGKPRIVRVSTAARRGFAGRNPSPAPPFRRVLSPTLKKKPGQDPPSAYTDEEASESCWAGEGRGPFLKTMDYVPCIR